ncbi:hypothetical protein N9L47_11530 [Rhodobacteraceae bacterium]|nr:hypothetical protein [Paracoccaceae bacterium]
MTNFKGLSADSEISDIFDLYPRNSKRLLRLLDDIMCADGALNRGEREAIAAFVSKQNKTPYCVFQHSAFSEVFSGPIDQTNTRIQPLLDYAFALHSKDDDRIKTASEAALSAGWSEAAIYKVVEVCGIFDFINNIVLAAGLKAPDGPMNPRPSKEDLKVSYRSMADAVSE